MIHEELREKVAKALFNTPFQGMGGVPLEWELSPGDIQQYYRDAAVVAIALALEEAAAVADRQAKQDEGFRASCEAIANEIRALSKPATG